MTIQRILIVSGTHGNEINPVWAVKQFNRKENSLNNGIEYEFIIGNPAAYEKGCRYVDVDLNRSFIESENFDQHKNSFYEINRANFLEMNLELTDLNPVKLQSICTLLLQIWEQALLCMVGDPKIFV